MHRVRTEPTLRLLLAVALVSAASACDDAGDRPEGALPERPNIVLMIGDDHGYPYFGFTGSEVVETPNLDRLAQAGTVFTHGFSTSNVCRPALWTLLTGLYPLQIHRIVERRTGEAMETGPDGRAQWTQWDRHYTDAIRSDPDTLPRALGRSGYASFQGGKYWDGSFEAAGFTEGTASGGIGRSVDRVQKSAVRFGRVTIDPLLDFIDRNRDRPFFVWYAPMMPHRPHTPPREMIARYEGTGLADSAKAYYAMCTWYDEGVGELLDHLDRKGLVIGRSSCTCRTTAGIRMRTPRPITLWGSRWGSYRITRLRFAHRSC